MNFFYQWDAELAFGYCGSEEERSGMDTLSMRQYPSRLVSLLGRCFAHDSIRNSGRVSKGMCVCLSAIQTNFGRCAHTLF